MQHVDPDVLALLALGEDVETTASADERDHLSACPLCADEVAELSAVALVGRGLTAEDTLVPPAPAVWERISAELGLGTASASGAGSTPTVAPAVTPAVAAPAHPAEPGSAPVVSLADQRARRERRRGGIGQVLVAACVALVLGVTAGVLWERRDAGTPAETPIASAELEALPDWADASGQARIEQTSSGVRQVVLDVEAPATEGGYREVWLIAGDLSGLVSLGVLEGSAGRFDIPAGLDLEKFSLVDVSEEHFDGDPAHSGDSVVRGALEDREA